MSHELRTPLNAVIGFSEIIRDAMMGPVSARYQEYARDICSSGEHLLSMINDTLDLSKIEVGQLEIYEETFDSGWHGFEMQNHWTESLEGASLNDIAYGTGGTWRLATVVRSSSTTGPGGRRFPLV